MIAIPVAKALKRSIGTELNSELVEYNITIVLIDDSDFGKLRLELGLNAPDLQYVDIERRGIQNAGKSLKYLSKKIFALKNKDLKDPLVKIQAMKALYEILIVAIGTATSGGFIVNAYIGNQTPIIVNVSDAKTVTISEDRVIQFQKDSCTVADLEKQKNGLK